MYGTAGRRNMLNFNSVLLSSENPAELIKFYGKVFDAKPVWAEGDWAAYQIGNGVISIGPHDKVKGKTKQPERIIFNFETTDVQGEFTRVKKTGAKVLAEPYQMEGMEGMWIATFIDPDGNYFQLMSPMK